MSWQVLSPSNSYKTRGKIWNNICFVLVFGQRLLLLLSRFSRVRLCATPQMAAHQAPLSLGFSGQEHWIGSPFPFPVHESEKWKWSCSVVSDSSRPPWTAAYQAPPSMGFSRQGYWSGVPLPSPLSKGINQIKKHLYLKKITELWVGTVGICGTWHEAVYIFFFFPLTLMLILG